MALRAKRPLACPGRHGSSDGPPVLAAQVISSLLKLVISFCWELSPSQFPDWETVTSEMSGQMTRCA